MERFSLGRVKAPITAYQINNPGSANLYSLNSARIYFVLYQFRPALKLIKADSPRPLVAERKWELEMKRFDENFTQMDGKAVSEAISETDRDGEWPERHRKTIIPYSLFSKDSIMGRQSASDKKKHGAAGT